MAVTAKIYTKGLAKCLTGDIDLNTDTIKAALVVATYTPDQNAHDFWDDVSANEVANGNGYTTGGVELATPGVTPGTGTVIFDSPTDPTWANSSITARYLVVYKSTGTAGTSPLIAYVDFGENMTSATGEFKVTLSTDGIVKITV
jgi:hypothetical protein